MPTPSQDEYGNRVLIVHEGPPGPGVPAGGTVGQVLRKTSGADHATEWYAPSDPIGAAVGPAVSVDGHVVLFDGTTGKLLKTAAVAFADLALKTEVNAKVSSVEGFGLSQSDFTPTEKAKLALLAASPYLGHYANSAALQLAADAVEPPSGSYATVGVAADIYFYVTGTFPACTWVVVAATAALPAGADLAGAIFNATDVAVPWTLAGCRIFTTAEKSLLAAHESLIQTLIGGPGAALTAIVTVAAGDYVALTTDRTIVCVHSVAAANCTLPLASENRGKVYCIKNVGSGGLVVTIVLTGADTYDGSATLAIGDYTTIQSTGSTWIKIG